MDKKAVSEIVGEMLLLSVVVILVAILSANISGLIPKYDNIPYANFLGIFDNNTTIIHEGGESIPLNSLRIILTTQNGSIISCNFEGSDLYCNGTKLGSLNDQNGNNAWDFGEILTIKGTVEKVVIAHEKGVLCEIFYK